jgi:uncharacterized metal-binding protein YceD (DUF177 family)
MEIRIAPLRERPRKLVFEEPIEGFPGLCELAAEGMVAFRRNLYAELVAELVATLVEVEGTITASVDLSCSRCLRPVEQLLTLPVAICAMASR